MTSFLSIHFWRAVLIPDERKPKFPIPFNYIKTGEKVQAHIPISHKDTRSIEWWFCVVESRFWIVILFVGLILVPLTNYLFNIPGLLSNASMGTERLVKELRQEENGWVERTLCPTSTVGVCQGGKGQENIGILFSYSKNVDSRLHQSIVRFGDVG